MFPHKSFLPRKTGYIANSLPWLGGKNTIQQRFKVPKAEIEDLCLVCSSVHFRLKNLLKYSTSWQKVTPSSLLITKGAEFPDS